MMLRILGRTYDTPRYVITNPQPEDTTQPSITAIYVEICNESSSAEAKVISDQSGDRKLQFDLIVPEDVEQAISRKLAIPLQEVSSLVQYKVSNACSR
ncbi:hypothetical protein [Leptolyngbya sp. Heron Island J]|uniref:hypothetical protein n=1 Tax=Leptolyngbya sp. Heron Island J TaxID=1385935 RepID=UPI001F20F409|nr:hypothetical protein [Leptolyngbya sp. Heron Island J]